MIRLPAVAGQFYPEDKRGLEKIINELLAKAEPTKIDGEIFGLLLPHAGYVYSGSVAAYGFKAVAGKKFDTVVIVGDSHCERFDGVAVWPEGIWQTPLGKVEVDGEAAKKIFASSQRCFRKDSAHLFEHSLEVQLPFLQKALKGFKILPIVFGSEDEDWQMLAETILKNIGQKFLIIASTDLSHYLPYEEAKKIDEQTLNDILNFQSEKLEVCAADSTKTLIEVAKKLGGKAELLKYANSGDTAGDKERVVGYGTVAFYL
jgi:AmmeMemoRadiSam system protein B